MTQLQADFIHHLEHTGYQPLARFVLESEVETEFSIVSLAPVYISTPQDSMEDVKAMGKLLLELEEMGEITLDYDIPLSDYPYEEYKTSELYAYFCQTVSERAKQPGFLGDTPRLELGSIALRRD
ncbi:hypothetical protein LJB77_02000 [Ruminococcaceae bacterium OttesenSCG-928-N02]|nr:hypothetical protein [Ruminococcaceae bacterium OttesenSCG-928-N02]